MIYCLQKIRYPALQICFIFYFLFIDMFVSDIFTEDVERIQGIPLYPPPPPPPLLGNSPLYIIFLGTPHKNRIFQYTLPPPKKNNNNNK